MAVVRPLSTVALLVALGACSGSAPEVRGAPAQTGTPTGGEATTQVESAAAGAQTEEAEAPAVAPGPGEDAARVEVALVGSRLALDLPQGFAAHGDGHGTTVVQADGPEAGTATLTVVLRATEFAPPADAARRTSRMLDAEVTWFDSRPDGAFRTETFLATFGPFVHVRVEAPDAQSFDALRRIAESLDYFDSAEGRARGRRRLLAAQREELDTELTPRRCYSGGGAPGTDAPAFRHAVTRHPDGAVFVVLESVDEDDIDDETEWASSRCEEGCPARCGDDLDCRYDCADHCSAQVEYSNLSTAHLSRERAPGTPVRVVGSDGECVGRLGEVLLLNDHHSLAVAARVEGCAPGDAVLAQLNPPRDTFRRSTLPRATADRLRESLLSGATARSSTAHLYRAGRAAYALVGVHVESSDEESDLPLALGGWTLARILRAHEPDVLSSRLEAQAVFSDATEVETLALTAAFGVDRPGVVQRFAIEYDPSEPKEFERVEVIVADGEASTVSRGHRALALASADALVPVICLF